MDKFISTSKFKSTLLAAGLLLLVLPLSSGYAASGCCSRHGGQSGQCDKASNHMICKDNTTSATCMCDGTKAAAAKTTKQTTVKAKTVKPKATTTKAVKSTTATKTKAVKSTKGAKPAKTAKPAKATKVKTDTQTTQPTQ